MQKFLLTDKRYWPTFWTMFFGAFNDNVFKNALIILITFTSYKLGSINPEMMVALCGGVFILPFFLFSSMAGQICDKFPKHKLVFYIKIWEVIVMIFGAFGFYFQNIDLLIITLFFMGLQSAFFGPVKYSILPELINDSELVQGNAYFSMGTFVSILLGTIIGGVLIAIPESGKSLVAISVLAFAIIGVIFSLGVKRLESNEQTLKININPFTSIWQILKITKEKKSIYLAVLGISWFWFLGAALLSMFPGFVKNYIQGDEHIVTLFLALFSIGVAVGSILCERLSKRGLELGLVPIGTFGITIFLILLGIFGNEIGDAATVNFVSFFESSTNILIIISLFGLSLFSGFFTVPLYTFIQQYSEPSKRSRVISGLNIINALFMVLAAVSLTVAYALNYSMPVIFIVLGVLNLIVSLYIYTVIPEYLLRFIANFLLKFIYKIKVEGYEHLPQEGKVILTCNHVSFIDWLVIAGAIHRPVRFIMYYKFMKIPFIKFLFKDARVIPICSQAEDAIIYENAFKEIDRSLLNDEVICIFPEGQITKDGELSDFKPGIDKILLSNPGTPIIPMALNGLWGSFFSKKYNGKALSNFNVLVPNWFSKITLKISRPVKNDMANSKHLQSITEKLIE